jgi:hypothetical protein
MHLLVHHQISKPDEFLAIVQSGGKFPEGFEVLAFLPDVSHQNATCIWEAPDVNSLRSLVEPVLKNTCVNTYQQIDDNLAMWLAKLTAAEMHA